jgi:hypothetical protein
MLDYIVFTSNQDLGNPKYFGGIEYTRSGPIGSIYTYTANTIVYTIGDYTFSGVFSITSATIPTIVTAIGNYAFNDCRSLTSLIIPSSGTSIGDGAFKGCISLTSITIPNTVTIINNATFFGCLSLTSIDIPTSVTRIGPFAFYYCINLTSVIIPSSVTSIDGNAFTECSKLTSINIPTSITSIGDYSFESCTSLTSLTIPSSVTSINTGTFRICSSLTEINIPNTITSIGENAFQGCSLLDTVLFTYGIVLNSTSFSECPLLTNVIIKVETIDPAKDYTSEYASYFSYQTTFTVSNTLCTAKFSYDYGPTVNFGSLTFNKIDTSPNFTYQCNTDIARLASDFSNNSYLQEITTPITIRSIGDYAFKNCILLSSLPSLSNITTIGQSAFQGCYSLTSIILSKATSIANSAFQDCYGLTEITLPTSISSIGNSVFQGCYGFTSFDIPISVLSIKNSAFQDCYGLTSITIPQRVTSIGDNAFQDCTNMNTITLPGSILSIGSSAFQGCSSLTSLSIPSQVSIIPESLCEYCSKLIDVIIPSNVQSIENNAFRGCSSMTVLLLPSILTSIGNNAFSGCTAFEIISVYSNITAVGNTIFDSTSNLIMKLTVPNRAVSLSTILVYTYTTANYPNIFIDIKYINDTTTTYAISVVKNTTQNTVSDTTSVVTCNAITQLRRSNIPTTVPIRFNPVSPYSKYTQDQLAMRRKSEILQYNANKQNTKQNGTTKKQAFSYLANNPQISASTNSITTRKVCDQNLISVPTSSSNVPGPIEYLYMDPSVPLYNYNDNRNYNSYIQTDTRKWNIFTYTDVETSATNDKTVMSIYVRNGIENNYTTFSLIEPVSITVSGSNNTITDYDLDFFRNTISITVTQVIFQIHYNTTTIQTITVSNPTNASTTNKLSVMYLDTSKSGSNPFSASIFIGNLELNDVVLYTPPNIIYDINILATVELDTGSQDYDVDAYFSNITYTAIYNTTSRVNTTNNCVAYSNTTNQYVSSIVGQ